MTIFDYLVLFVLVSSVIISTLRGLVKEILSLLGWIVAFVPLVILLGSGFAMRNPTAKGTGLLYWAIVALVVAVIAGVLGFGGIAGAAADIAKILFWVFLVIFLVVLVMNFMGRGRGPTV